MSQYLRYLVISLITILLITGLASYLLDPFGYFRITGLRGKYGLGDNVWGDDRTAKALALPSLQPDTLLLGTSKVQRGFDVNDQDILKDLGNSYNLGLRGATIDELDLFLKYAINYHSPSNIIIGFDFARFIFTNKTSTPTFMNHEMSFVGHITSLLHRTSFTLWSKNSLMNVVEMHFISPPLYLNGTKNHSSKIEKLRRIGVRTQSQLIEKLAADRLMLYKNTPTYYKSMATLNKLTEYICNKNMRIKFFISPVHIRHLLLLKGVGLQDRFFAWKRALTNITENHRLNGCDINLVDFSRISKYTTDPLPPISDLTTTPRWFWESSHYKPALGKLIINRLWSHNKAAPDFGVTLDNESIDGEIKAARKELIQYQNEHPQLVKELHDNVM